MKFAFMIATRGNPARAAAVIEVAKALASGQHDIKYIIGCDRDDPATHSWFWQTCPEIEVSIDERPIGIGSVWNRLCELVHDADIYCPFPDDVFIAKPDWDAHIVQGMQYIERPQLRVLAWNDLTNFGQCTLPVVSKAWLDLTGKLYDDRFPYWFYDTCVDELYSFITGNRILIPTELTFVSKKGVTKNMRELAFWWDLYVATRTERLQRADHIREQLGITLKPGVIDEWVQSWQRRDKKGYDTAIEIEQGLSGERKPPSEQYRKARDMAAAYLSHNKAITPAHAGLA